MTACDHCGAAGARARCGRCRGVAYCGRDCQRAGWRAHRPLCGSTDKPKAKKQAPAMNLYPDKAGSRDEVLLQRMVEKVERGEGTESFQGICAKLLQPDEFRRLVYPGLDAAEQGRLPQTFREAPMYRRAIVDAMPRVVARADEVLGNVKRRGAEQGDVMDAATEEALRPQVLQEAFARQVIATVAEVNRRSRAEAATVHAPLAAPLGAAAEAEAAPLAAAAVAGLLDPARGWGLAPGFMDEDWRQLVADDAARFERFSAIPSPSSGDADVALGEMAWVEPPALEQQGFPALAELLLELHKLPARLNARAPELQLCAPLQGATMLTRRAPGCGVPPRVDCGQGRFDTGYRVSALYFVAGGGVVGLGPAGQAGQAQVEVEAEAGALLLYRSDSVLIEMCCNEGEEDQLAVTSWLSGRTAAGGGSGSGAGDSGAAAAEG